MDQMTEDRLNRIEDKIDKIIEQMGKQDKALTEVLSTRPIYIEQIQDLEKRIIPLEKHSNMMSGAVKLLGILVTVLTILLAIQSMRR